MGKIKIREIILADNGKWIEMAEISYRKNKEWAEQKLIIYISPFDSQLKKLIARTKFNTA